MQEQKKKMNPFASTYHFKTYAELALVEPHGIAHFAVHKPTIQPTEMNDNS
jgi:hypothetical protein